MAGVSSGFHLVTSKCDTHTVTRNYRSSQQHSAQVEHQIRQELLNGRYRAVAQPPRKINAIGAIPKPDGGIRLIHDLSRPAGQSVNESYEQQSSIRMATALGLARTIGRGWWLCKVDLQAAYRSVRCHPDDSELAGLQWQFAGDKSPTFMVDTRLPFGASASVEAFHRLSQAVARMLHRRGFRHVAAYLDDFCLAFESRQECEAGMHELLRLLRRLGFAISWKKLVPPTQSLTFLGLRIDTVAGSIRVPQDKLEETEDRLKRHLRQRSISKRQLQSLIGKLS
jgi:hypothetical protein